METTTQIYLQITLDDGREIEGEAKAGGYENRIDIDSFSFKASAKKQLLKDVQGKDVKANLDFHSVSISKVFDRASLQLASLMNKAEKDERRFKEAKIAVDQQFIDPEWTGKERNEILIFYLYEGYVESIKLRTSESGAGASLKEDIELTFRGFEIDYYAEDRESGKLAGDYRWQWHGFRRDPDTQED
jgi:type VI protein secretion system component Hcp